MVKKTYQLNFLVPFVEILLALDELEAEKLLVDLQRPADDSFGGKVLLQRLLESIL
jgi:hypothetical protein